ncbi:MAG TPA: WD40 repeat domain-containing protein, partial [Planctomycetaceae bacterium]|nr:WD40 repeat domain-containing protein [Planctomycetaceae bacterium]
KSVHFSPDGSVQIVRKPEGVAQFVRTSTREVFQEVTVAKEGTNWKGEHYVRADCSDVTFSADLVGLYNNWGVLRIHRWRTGQLLSHMTITDPDVIDRLAFGDEQIALSSDLSHFVIYQPSTTRANQTNQGLCWLFDIPSGRLVLELGGVFAVAALEDGRLIGALQSRQQQRLQLWDLKANRAILDFAGTHDWDADRGAFTRNGRYLAACESGRCITVWDVQTGAQLLKAALTPTEGFASDPQVSEDGRYLAAATFARGFGFRLAVWDVATGNELWSRDFPPAKPAVKPPIFWNAASSWKLLKGPIILPDGKRFAAGPDEAHLRIWDLRTGADE